MPEHADLKSKTYLGQMVHFAETLLGVQLKRYGDERFAGFCPFHKDFTPHSGKGSGVSETETEPDDAIAFSSAPALGQDITDALRDASRFYNDLLLSDDERFDHIGNYLTRRGVG